MTPGRPGVFSMTLLGDWARVGPHVGPSIKLAPLLQGTRSLLTHSVTSTVMSALAWPPAHLRTTWGLLPQGLCLCFPLTLRRLSQYALVLTPGRVLGMMISLLRWCDILPQISVALSRLINVCLEAGHFPDFMKVAQVTLIFKADDPTEFGNYRPISVLSVFSKVFPS